MIDIPPGQVQVVGMPEVDDDLEVVQVDVVVRVRRRRGDAPETLTASDFAVR
jgi:hypothetical protein